MHEPIKIKDLIKMLQRENSDDYVHIAVSELSDINDESIRYKKFASDLSIVVRDNGIYILSRHV